MRFFAGWISRSVSAGDVAFESSSVQISWRSPVAASIRTTGWFASNDSPSRAIGTAPVLVERGRRVHAGDVEEDQRPRAEAVAEVLMSVGSMWTPSTLAGVEAGLRLRRSPVSVVESGRVK